MEDSGKILARGLYPCLARCWILISCSFSLLEIFEGALIDNNLHI